MAKRHKESYSDEFLEVNLIDENTRFQVVEAYKTLRTNLFFTLSNAKNKISLISSPEPNSGKSMISSNLAITIAQTGAKVILLDADMRKPTQHKNFSVPNSLGLSYLLSDLCRPSEAIIKNIFPNLDLITSGAIPPNPSELLGSKNMRSLLDKLFEEYDYILIDTPPIGVTADALTFLNYTAGMLLVARQSHTSYKDLARCVDQIERINGTLLGVVLNDVSSFSSKYYGNYNYTYGEK